MGFNGHVASLEELREWYSFDSYAQAIREFARQEESCHIFKGSVERSLLREYHAEASYRDHVEKFDLGISKLAILANCGSSENFNQKLAVALAKTLSTEEGFKLGAGIDRLQREQNGYGTKLEAFLKFELSEFGWRKSTLSRTKVVRNKDGKFEKRSHFEDLEIPVTQEEREQFPFGHTLEIKTSTDNYNFSIPPESINLIHLCFSLDFDEWTVDAHLFAAMEEKLRKKPGRDGKRSPAAEAFADFAQPVILKSKLPEKGLIKEVAMEMVAIQNKLVNRIEALAPKRSFFVSPWDKTNS